MFMSSCCIQSCEKRENYELDFKGTNVTLRWHQAHQNFISGFITGVMRPLRFNLTCRAKCGALKILSFEEYGHCATLQSTRAQSLLKWMGCKGSGWQYLQVWEAVLEEDVPVVEEELLLTNTQQACHQGIESLGTETEQCQHQKKGKG